MGPSIAPTAGVDRDSRWDGQIESGLGSDVGLIVAVVANDAVQDSLLAITVRDDQQYKEGKGEK